MAKLAIVFIIHNSFGRLKFMLEKIDSEDGKDCEIFIIDNKSSDTYRDLLLNYLPEKEFQYDINLIELDEEKSIEVCEERAAEYVNKKGINNIFIYALT
jgi:hypothetical protein